MRKDNDILKHISKEETSKDFSNKVMQDIYALENEKLLSKMLSTNTKVKPSSDFTDSVMNKIESINAKKKVVEIFNFWQKGMIALSFIVLILLSIFSKNETKTLPQFDYSFFNFSNILNNNFLIMTGTFSMSLFCIAVLLAIEFYFKNTKRGV